MKNKSSFLNTIELSEAVSSRRAEDNLSLRDVEKEIKVSSCTIHRIENGEGCEIDVYVKLILWLNVPFERFLNLPLREPNIFLTRIDEPISTLIPEIIRRDPSLSVLQKDFLSRAFNDLCRQAKEFLK